MARSGKGQKPTEPAARSAAVEAIKSADDKRTAAVEQAIASVRATSKRAQATYSLLDTSTREAVATGRLVIDRTTDEPVVLAVQSLIQRAGSLYQQATGEAWGDDVNEQAARLARSKRSAGPARAIGSRANVEAMRQYMGEYIADCQSRGKPASVTPAAKWAQPDMKRKYGVGAFNWPMWQQLWCDMTGDVAVGARGDAMMAGVAYGGGDYRPRVLVWADGPDASERGRAMSAAQRAYEAEREQRAAEAAKVAAAQVKATAAAQRREAAKVKRAAGKADQQAAKGKSAKGSAAKCAGSGAMPTRALSPGQGVCAECGGLVRCRLGKAVGHAPKVGAK